MLEWRLLADPPGARVDGRFGAVVPPQEGSDTGRIEGRLVITDSCVYVDASGERTFLYWPADRTTWDGPSRSIAFANHTGPTITVREGDEVVLGGGGDRRSESGRTDSQWLSQVTWVVRPNASCSLASRWGVGAVLPPSQPNPGKLWSRSGLAVPMSVIRLDRLCNDEIHDILLLTMSRETSGPS